MTDATPPPEQPPLDIQKPKQARGWRVLLTDVGIVVLGVGLALAAQQTVEWWQWRGQVQQAREVIATEMARNIAFGVQRMQLARCTQSRLRAIETVLTDATQRGTLPPLGSIGVAMVNPWSSGAWESVVASQTASHFPRQELAALSLIYTRVTRVENWNRQEAEAWSFLQTLPGPSRRFDPSYGTELRKALAVAQLHNYFIAITSQRFIRDTQSQNLPFTLEEQQGIADAKNSQAERRAALCAPIGATPAVSQNKLSETVIQQIEGDVKRLLYQRPSAGLRQF